MITEEKLCNFIDGLRLGKYNTEQYVIFCIKDKMHIKDTTNNVDIELVLFENTSCPELIQDMSKWNKLPKIIKFFHKSPNPDKYIKKISYWVSLNRDSIAVSEALFHSLRTYIDEIIEKDKLVQKLNIKESFGLD